MITPLIELAIDLKENANISNSYVFFFLFAVNEHKILKSSITGIDIDGVNLTIKRKPMLWFSGESITIQLSEDPVNLEAIAKSCIDVNYEIKRHHS